VASQIVIHPVRQSKSAIVPTKPPGTYAVRRIFNNCQIIERFEKWLLVCGKAENTRLSYTLAAKQFAKFLIDKPLTAATKEDVRAFIASLYARGLAPATMQLRLDSLRVFFDCLALGGQVHVSVPRLVKRRKLPQRLPHAKSEQEIEQLIAAAHTTRDRAILELGYASGLRVSELANLHVEDVNIRARSLTVRMGKGGSDRIALFGNPAAVALRDYVGDRMSGRIFLQHPHRQRGGVWMNRWHIWYGQWRENDDNGKRVMRTVRLGGYDIPNKERARLALDAYLRNENRLPERKPDTKPLGRKGVYRVIVAVAKRAGLTGVHPHTLRHSMATHCLNRGMDIRFVQELLGHTSLVATQKYLHVATAQLQRIHTKFHPHGGDGNEENSPAATENDQ
jgi:site-specific recombinase XerD